MIGQSLFGERQIQSLLDVKDDFRSRPPRQVTTLLRSERSLQCRGAIVRLQAGSPSRHKLCSPSLHSRPMQELRADSVRSPCCSSMAKSLRAHSRMSYVHAPHHSRMSYVHAPHRSCCKNPARADAEAHALEPS